MGVRQLLVAVNGGLERSLPSGHQTEIDNYLAEVCGATSWAWTALLSSQLVLMDLLFLFYIFFLEGAEYNFWMQFYRCLKHVLMNRCWV